MKKILIKIIPLLVILFIPVVALCGLRDLLILIGALLLSAVLATLFIKWTEFVDKHIKD
jgi:ABC-type uncharacterized transport system permease subunit